MSTQPSTQVQALRKTLGAFLTGVTVVTTVDAEGRPRGMTANSFTSVSLDPPLVLVCIDRSAASFDAFRDSTGYAVHILGAQQRDLAVKFASKDPDKFDGLETVAGMAGAPILAGVPGWLDCETEQAVEAGDHVLLIGRVRDFRHADERPLGFHQGRFVTFDPDLDIQMLKTVETLCVGWVAGTDDGRVAIERRTAGCGIPLRPTTTRALTDEALSAQAADAIGVPVTTQFLYSMYPRDGIEDLALVYRGVIEPRGPVRLSPGVELHSEQSLPWDLVRNRSELAILRRYFRERDGQGFGIYAGTEASGTVAMVSAPYSTPPAPADRDDTRTYADRSQQ